MRSSQRFAVASLVIFFIACGDPPGDGDAGVPDATGFDASIDGPFRNIEDELNAIAGVTGVTEYPTDQPGYRFFYIVFEQPEDHDATGGKTFGQVLSIHHRSWGAPMVLASTGYDNYMGDRLTEPTRLLKANQIVVEHRFFAESRPDPADWDKLRIYQAASDHHRIVEAFAPLYEAAWVSTGASKGGMTSIYHRRFFPDDVDATVAYVAPISFGAPDGRYQAFFDSVGDATCRERLHAFQREVLLRRATLEPMAVADAASEGWSFTIAGTIEAAFEAEAFIFEWYFWQYMHADWCDYIPTAGSSDADIYEFFNYGGGVDGSSDASYMRFMPYYFQAEVELGEPDYEAAHMEDLLIHGDGEVPLDDIFPAGVAREYDPTAMVDIADWVDADGSELMFIYGEYDPWTAGEFELGGAVDSYKYEVAHGNHGASILQLGESDLSAALANLESWTGVTPVVPDDRDARVDAEPPRLLPPAGLRLRRR